MSFLEDILKILNPEAKIVKQEEVVAQAPSPGFYANIDKTTFKILSISPTCSYETGTRGIPIDDALALTFLTGEENLNNWEIQVKGDEMRLSKILRNERAVYNRVEIASIVELESTPKRSGKKVSLIDEDILIVAGNNEARIYYDGDRINSWSQPARLYFTGEGDPSYLKCAFRLDVNILNDIVKLNKLKKWPNPVVIPLDDTTDLSVFILKSPLTINLNHI
jgi:hypothetical protein